MNDFVNFLIFFSNFLLDLFQGFFNRVAKLSGDLEVSKHVQQLLIVSHFAQFRAFKFAPSSIFIEETIQKTVRDLDDDEVAALIGIIGIKKRENFELSGAYKCEIRSVFETLAKLDFDAFSGNVSVGAAAKAPLKKYAMKFVKNDGKDLNNRLEKYFKKHCNGFDDVDFRCGDFLMPNGEPHPTRKSFYCPMLNCGTNLTSSIDAKGYPTITAFMNHFDAFHRKSGSVSGSTSSSSSIDHSRLDTHGSRRSRSTSRSRSTFSPPLSSTLFETPMLNAIEPMEIEEVVVSLPIEVMQIEEIVEPMKITDVIPGYKNTGQTSDGRPIYRKGPYLYIMEASAELHQIAAIDARGLGYKPIKVEKI